MKNSYHTSFRLTTYSRVIISPLIFRPSFQGRSPVSILAPSVTRISMKLRDITATRRRDSAQSGLIITFDRDYGNEAANYKKGLQAFRRKREREKESRVRK